MITSGNNHDACVQFRPASHVACMCMQVVTQPDALLSVPQQLADLGALKLTFVGGEPLLHPQIVDLVAAAKAAGLTTCMVTNASLLDEQLMQQLQGSLDWMTFSIDASSDALHARMGRGLARDVARGAIRRGTVSAADCCMFVAS